MTPSARLAAATEVLDLIAETRAPADSVLRRWGQGHRFAGSGDRRAIAERVYRCLRDRARLAWAMGESGGRALVLGSLRFDDQAELFEIEALFQAGGYGPAPLTDDERQRLAKAPEPAPEWVEAGLPDFAAADLQTTFGDDWQAEAKALMASRAPLDLRINGAKSSVEDVKAELAAEGLAPELTPWSAWGLRLPSDRATDVMGLAAFREGRIEVQDEGSQLAAWFAGAEPGMRVVDYCAGGGGKTLALGHCADEIVACDVDQARLDNIIPRLARAGIAADLRKLGPNGEGMQDLEGAADLVLVDAPCSGSGTWRRHPEGAWRLTEAEVDALHKLQVEILDRASYLVRPGGRLAYVTCSVLARENEATITAFEAAHPEFTPRPIATALKAPEFTPEARDRLGALAQGHTLRLTPRLTATDGFFIALYERPA